MKWLITGGAGFIGTNLVASLLEQNPETDIRVLDNLSVGTREDLAAATPPGARQVQLVEGDIRDPETCLHAAQERDIIVHLAANTGVGPSVDDPRADMEANVRGTFNMLEAARHHKARAFIFASSGAPVGEVDPPIHEEIAPHPVSPYGASKLAGEAYCSAYCRTFGLETIALRFGNVYGPRSRHKSSVVAQFIRNAMTGETLEIYGDGTQTRDFIYIQDLVRAVFMASQTPNIGGEVFQIATSREHTVNELVDILVPLMKKAGYTNLRVENKAPRLGDVQRNFSDTTKARNTLGWQAQTSLQEGVQKTLDWFLSQNP